MIDVNKNAPFYATESITIDAETQLVWEKLADIDSWPKWLTMVKKAKINGPLKADTTFNWVAGGMPIKSTLHTVIPYFQIGWTGKAFGLYAVHNWVFVDLKGKTKVTVTESMEGLLLKLFKKYLNKSLQSDMRKSLELLKNACE
ncbi:MAG: SRPBCC family protein [Cytophagaceae bacterium]|nr:SRPBCC family protein [Cytophagaceae bacterium]MBL0300539.1 SRPBCC family protein [Cytophagaceae bacterium]MBL0327473.1 SRPBCC family protein [Cytophagaceae bacterium]